jgi:hypothetical protein
LPYHYDSSENAVPVANPCLVIPKNSLMLGGEQFIFIAYQAFEEVVKRSPNKIALIYLGEEYTFLKFMKWY